jgi:hypothetical protein
MLTYITQALSVFDFEKYADLYHPYVVYFWFWKVCRLTSPRRCLFLISKCMLTYITQTLSVFFILKSMLTYITQTWSVFFYFTKYADTHHPVVICSWF